MIAREHAKHANALLAGASALSERLAQMTAQERLEVAVVGGIAAANADLRWTVELAVAHALVSIALSLDGLEVRVGA